MKPGSSENMSLDFIEEQPLEIRIEGIPCAVVMRTPGEEVFQVAGFCLGERIVEDPDDFRSIEYSDQVDPNVIHIRLVPDKARKIRELLEKRIFIKHTGGGISRNQRIQDFIREHAQGIPFFEFELREIIAGLKKLGQNQTHYQTTRGSHAALICGDQLEVISFSEDVGRHNALDKAIGRAFMNRKLPRARLLFLSSRVSFEMVEKAVRARLAVIVSESRPTAMAVATGLTLGLTLAFSPGKKELVILCGQHRIRGD